MSDQLPGPWRRWERDRVAEMIAFGIAPEVARDVAHRDALGRARAAQVVGFKAARDAKLIWTDLPDGTTRWHLVLDPSDVPPERRETGRRALGAVRVS